MKLVTNKINHNLMLLYYLLHQLWSTSWNETYLNGYITKDRSKNLSHHEWMLYYGATSCSWIRKDYVARLDEAMATPTANELVGTGLEI